MPFLAVLCSEADRDRLRRGKWIPKASNACFICRSPALSTTHSHKAEESLAIGLKPEDHVAHPIACGVEWPLAPWGYMAVWLLSFFMHESMYVP